MPAYYFSMEGYHTGKKPDPTVDKLITIQYQKINLTTGQPLGELTILKEWESSEQAIITKFVKEFFRQDMPVTSFIPVGMNLDYEYEMIIAKCRQYNLPVITSHQIYFERPRFDLRPIVVLLNDGRFSGARLDLFSSKNYDRDHMRKWYESKDFRKIEHFIRKETGAVLKLLQYLSKYKTRLGITKKEEGSNRKPAPTSSAASWEPVHSARPTPGRFPSSQPVPICSPPPSPKSLTHAIQQVKKQTDARTPSQKKSPTKLLKAEPGTQRKGSAQLGKAQSGAHRSSAPPFSFRKNAPMKKAAGKRR